MITNAGRQAIENRNGLDTGCDALSAYQLTLQHDVNLDGVPIKAGSIIRMDGQPTLATACRLAGVDHQTYLRIRAYMPAAGDLQGPHWEQWNAMLDVCRMAASINPFGDRKNAMARLKAQALLSSLGMWALDDSGEPEPAKVDVPQPVRDCAIRRVQHSERGTDARYLADYILSIDSNGSAT